MTSKAKTVFAAAALALAAGTAQAAPVQWTAGSGGNGNWYEVIFGTSSLSWSSANALATSSTFLGVNGYLASVTSAAEDAFLNTLNPNNVRAWLGGTDAAVEGVWEWTSGEAFTYTNWAGGEPNNLFNEDYLTGWWNGTNWNDLPDGTWRRYVTAYVVEYDVSVVPLPAGMPLILGALGMLGLVGRRRKARKAT